MRKARGAEMPESLWSDPLMYQGLSDGFLGPRDPIAVASEDWGIDFEDQRLARAGSGGLRLRHCPVGETV